MTSTDTTTATAQADAAETETTRTFHTSDWRHAARLLQDARHVKGNRYEPKPDESQVKVDQLAAAMAAAFEADATGTDGAPFSAAYFTAGTQLPQAPTYGQAVTETEEDDPDAEDDDDPDDETV